MAATPDMCIWMGSAEHHPRRGFRNPARWPCWAVVSCLEQDGYAAVSFNALLLEALTCDGIPEDRNPIFVAPEHVRNKSGFKVRRG